MKILKANKTIKGYTTQSVNVNDLAYGELRKMVWYGH